MEEQKITETLIVEKIKEFLITKQNGNWHEEKSKISDLHGHGADIVMTGGSRNGERFIASFFSALNHFTKNTVAAVVIATRAILFAIKSPVILHRLTELLLS